MTPRVNRILQANVNHVPTPQDLLLQDMAERDVTIAVVAEPYRVLSRHPHWAVNSTGSAVAITWRRTNNPIPCTSYEAGRDYVAVR